MIRRAWIIPGVHPGVELWRDGHRHTLQTGAAATRPPDAATHQRSHAPADVMQWAERCGYTQPDTSGPPAQPAPAVTYFVNASSRVARDGLAGTQHVTHTDGRAGYAGSADGDVATSRQPRAYEVITDGRTLAEWLASEGWS